MQSLTRGPVLAGLALATAVALSPALSAQAPTQQPTAQPQPGQQQQACVAEVTPAQVAAGQAAVRLTVALSQNAGEIRSINGAQSGIALAQPTDLPRTELSAGGQQPRPIAMGAGQNTWTVWVNTTNARPGTHAVGFVANSPCAGEVTVTAAAAPARSCRPSSASTCTAAIPSARAR